jgi:hypothetical protein
MLLSDRRSRSGLSSPPFAPQRNLTKLTCQLQRSRA